MHYKAVAVTGPSGSGKTTLIEKISRHLSSERRIAIIKHDPKDKAIFDQKGKDSDRFFKTGAEVAVVSPTRTTLFSHQSRDVEEIAALLAPFDLLLVEGLKNLPLPRLGVFRGTIDPDYLPVLQAVAIDESIDSSTIQKLPQGIDVLDLNNVGEVIEWIDSHAISLERKIKQC